MASGDFADLKLQLARLAGRAAVSEMLAGDQALAGQCVNETLLDCYMNPGGRRPRWAMNMFGLQLGVPITRTIGVTQGSKVFTGYAAPEARIGSCVQVGSSWYTLAGQVGAGSGSQTGQTNQVPLVIGQQSYAIVFNTPFEAIPTFFSAVVMMGSDSGEIFTATPDLSTLTESGVTVWLSGIPTADSSGSVINWNAAASAVEASTLGDFEFVEPVVEATGNYSATFYHNSYSLDANIVEVQGDPLVLGWGILRPMTGRGEDYKWRQIAYGDFWTPSPQGAGLLTNINWPGGLSNPVGTPLFYYIENNLMIGVNPIKSRFVVQPMPIQITTIQFNGWTLPDELVDDTDRPILPGDLVSRVLLPLCREKWALIYKKYTGGNQQAFIRAGDAAREILNLSGRGQRDRPVREPLRNC